MNVIFTQKFDLRKNRNKTKFIIRVKNSIYTINIKSSFYKLCVKITFHRNTHYVKNNV
jgi:hypothetical protein